MRRTRLSEVFGKHGIGRVAAVAVLAGSASLTFATEQVGGPQLVPPAPEPTLVAIQAADAPPPAGDYFETANHGIEIIPSGTSAAEVSGRSYDDVYQSIPFNHTEYLANPAYRHEATMEILFQQMRPTTVVKNYEPQVIVNDVPSPYQPYVWSHYDGCQYRPPAFRLLNPGCTW